MGQVVDEDEIIRRLDAIETSLKAIAECAHDTHASLGGWSRKTAPHLRGWKKELAHLDNVDGGSVIPCPSCSMDVYPRYYHECRKEHFYSDLEFRNILVPEVPK